MGPIRRIVESKPFDLLVAGLIIVNSLLLGVSVQTRSATIDDIQTVILWIFVIELAMRWVGRASTRAYLSDGWNYFDIILVAFGLLSEIDGLLPSDLSVLRGLRVIRVFRLFRIVEELRLMTTVLLRSLKSMIYSGILFLVFFYVYAVLGVSLFRTETYAEGTPGPLVTEPHPYENIGWAMFTLFRVLTGEDWTDVVYNMSELSPDGRQPTWVVMAFHVSWVILAAFVLLNLVVGAVVTNYDTAIEERKKLKAAMSGADETGDGRQRRADDDEDDEQDRDDPTAGGAQRYTGDARSDDPRPGGEPGDGKDSSSS